MSDLLVLYHVPTRQAGFDPAGCPETLAGPPERPDGRRTGTADIPEPSFCLEDSVGQVFLG